MIALTLEKKPTPNPTLYLLFSFLLIYSGKLSNGKVLVNPSDTSVLEGNGATLFCEFQWDSSLMGTACSWSRDGMNIDVAKFVEVGLYQWIGDPQNGNCSLRFVNSSLDLDQGSWRCLLPATTTQPGEISSAAKLTVLVQPSNPILFKSNQSDLLVGDTFSIFENETATITCTSHHANPAPNLSWIFNSEDLDATKDTTSNDDLRKNTYKRSITLQKKFNKDDNGKILRCDLKHESLNNTENYVETHMNIQYGTTVVEILSPNYVLVDEGAGYSFVCKADGNPAASFEWMYKKTDDADWKIISENNQYEIASATASDVGKYMCLAGNNEKMRPSSEIQFDLRDGTKNIIGIIAGVFGAVLVIAVIVLTVVVIRLRRGMKVKITNSIPRLPSMAELNRIESTGGSRTNTMRDTTYMIPVPTELAPLHPPFYHPIYRDKNRKTFDENASFRSRGNAESNIYSEPHLYEEIIDQDKKENYYERKDNSSDKEENISDKKDDTYEERQTRNEITETDF